VVDDKTALINRLSATLKEYFPQALELFSDLSTKMVCEFILRWPTLEAAKKAKRCSLERFFRRHHSANQQLLAKRMKILREALPLTTDRATIECYSLRAQATCMQIKAATEAMAVIEKELKAVACEHPDLEIFESFPGAGMLTAARFVAVFGTDRERFGKGDEVSCTVGIAPITRRTGNGNCVTVHKRNFCPRFERQTFHEFAGQSILYSFWANAYYKREISKGKTPQAAKRSLAHKWIRIIYACWKNGVPYDEVKYLRSLQQKGSPLLQYISEQQSVAAA
jgi:transposase